MKRFSERHLEPMFDVPPPSRLRFIMGLPVPRNVPGPLPARSAEQVLEEVRIAAFLTKQLFKFLGADRSIIVFMIGPGLPFTPVKAFGFAAFSLVMLPLRAELVVFLSFFSIG